MIDRRFAILVITLACAASAASAQTTRRSSPIDQPQAATTQRSYSDRYGMLEQRNIFLRDRSRPTTQRSSSTAPTQPARRPEQMLVLTGVVLEDDGFRAYLEDASASPPKIVRVSPGDNLGPGRVVEIQIDAIAFENAGQHKWIEVGSDLTGQSVGPQLSGGSVATTTAPSDGAAAAAAPNLDPNDPNLTVEQRMRARSAQQRQGR